MKTPGVLFNHQSTHARPDEKMGRQRKKRWRCGPLRWITQPNTAVRQAEQRSANAKRRRRDRTESEQ
jgi:hypothetical protein